MNPFSQILKASALNVDVDGPAIPDQSLDENGERKREYVNQIRDIVNKPAFEQEYKLHLQYIWHSMDQDSYKACHIAASMFNQFYRRFLDLAQEAKEMDEKEKPVELELSNEPLPPGEVDSPEGNGFAS